MVDPYGPPPFMTTLVGAFSFQLLDPDRRESNTTPRTTRCAVIPTPEILNQWRIEDDVAPVADGGLINETFAVGRPPRAILQRVNPIFGPEVHGDIDAITAHLAGHDVATPRLIRTTDGALCVPTDKGAWRLLTYLPGTTVHRIQSPQQAASAAELVGRFHRATQDFEHTFAFVRPGAHDTVAHMHALRTALDASSGDPMEGPACTIGREILQRWETWSGSLDLPMRISHGDLKISNLRFDESKTTARGLLDLDTLSHQSIAVEMGDAWRSWCNTAGEDNPEEAHFDLEIFEASASSWLNHGPDLGDHERANLVAGIERICLELAARFCADALNRSYFKEDRRRFPTAGEHNIHRARGQLAVARSVHHQRLPAERIVQSR